MHRPRTSVKIFHFGKEEQTDYSARVRAYPPSDGASLRLGFATPNVATNLAPDRWPFIRRPARQPSEELHACHPVAILGAGHGGMALAGHLALQGHHVTLWNRSQARVTPVSIRGGIRLTMA